MKKNLTALTTAAIITAMTTAHDVLSAKMADTIFLFMFPLLSLKSIRVTGIVRLLYYYSPTVPLISLPSNRVSHNNLLCVLINPGNSFKISF